MLDIRGLTLTSWLILPPFALTSLFLREVLTFYFAKKEGVAFPARACVLLDPLFGWWHHRGSNFSGPRCARVFGLLRVLGLWAFLVTWRKDSDQQIYHYPYPPK